jgi:hypothetical protein
MVYYYVEIYKESKYSISYTSRKPCLKTNAPPTFNINNNLDMFMIIFLNDLDMLIIYDK